MHQISDFQALVERPLAEWGLCGLGGSRGLRVLRNLRGPYQRPLQRLIKLQRNDVVDPLALQVPQKRILTEPGVRASRFHP